MLTSRYHVWYSTGSLSVPPVTLFERSVVTGTEPRDVPGRLPEAIKAARDWLATTAGQDAVRRSLQQVETRTAELEERRRIDARVLDKPVTL